MSKFLITGTGRCGTTYCQRVLTLMGLNVTHQTLFTFSTMNACTPSQVEWGNVDGEASFMAVPWLREIKETGVKIIHVYRDRNLVVDSWLRLGLFGDQMHISHPLFYPHVGGKNRNPRRRAEYFYDHWTRSCNDHADTIMHIEDANPSQLAQAVGRYDLYADANGDLTEGAKRAWLLDNDINSSVSILKEQVRYRTPAKYKGEGRA